jgi:hypothetical protein
LVLFAQKYKRTAGQLGFIVPALLSSGCIGNLVINSPVSAMMRNTRAIAFRQVATQQPADYGAPCPENHERNSCGESAREIRKQEDTNSRIHQNRQHNS